MSAGSGAEEGHAPTQVCGVNQVAGSDGGLEAQRRAIAAACSRHGWLPLKRLARYESMLGRRGPSSDARRLRRHGVRQVLVLRDTPATATEVFLAFALGRSRGDVQSKRDSSG